MNDAGVAAVPLCAARHPLAWVPTLYLAQGLPFYAVALVAGCCR
jgi:PAT family beta-lactamase induction signal transducer AmpG